MNAHSLCLKCLRFNENVIIFIICSLFFSPSVSVATMVTMDNALQNQETDVCESVQLSHNINHEHSHYVNNQ